MERDGTTLGVLYGSLLSLGGRLTGGALGNVLVATSSALLRTHGPVLLLASRGIPMLAESLSLLVKSAFPLRSSAHPSAYLCEKKTSRPLYLWIP